MPSSPRVVIQDPSRLRRRRIAVAVAAAALLTLVWGAYILGRVQAPGDWQRYRTSQQRLDSERKRLLTENRKLKAENNRLSERVVMLERSADIDEQASTELRDSLSDMQTRMAHLKKELAFYRGILSPQKNKAGVQVEQFTLTKDARDRVYKFDLVLVQAARHDRDVRGSVQLRMDGLRDGEAISFTLSDIALDPDAKLVFSFKYFQELTGTLRIPQNFKPTLVELEVTPKSRGAESFVDSYDWGDLIQADAGSASAREE